MNHGLVHIHAEPRVCSTQRGANEHTVSGGHREPSNFRLRGHSRSGWRSGRALAAARASQRAPRRVDRRHERRPRDGASAGSWMLRAPRSGRAHRRTASVKPCDRVGLRKTNRPLRSERNDRSIKPTGSATRPSSHSPVVSISLSEVAQIAATSSAAIESLRPATRTPSGSPDSNTGADDLSSHEARLHLPAGRPLRRTGGHRSAIRCARRCHRNSTPISELGTETVHRRLMECWVLERIGPVADKRVVAVDRGRFGPRPLPRSCVRIRRGGSLR